MNERKNRANPTHGYQNQTFEQEFAARFNAQRINTDKNPRDTDEPKENPQTEPTPPEALMRAWEHITEHANGIMAVFTILIFVATTAYAVISTLQWRAMRAANELTNQVLELNRKVFDATQSAGLDCQANQNIVQYPGNVDTDMFIQVSCNNRGESGATNVSGTMDFTRSQNQKVHQHESRSINQRVVLKGSGIYRVFHVTSKYSWDWLKEQDMTISVSLSYWNGIETISPEPWCWRLLTRPQERSFSFTDCENWSEWRKTVH